MKVDTVKVVSDNPDHNGYVVINADDFDADEHELFEGEVEGEAEDEKPKGWG